MLKARTHADITRTHAHITRTLNHTLRFLLFCSCSFRLSRSTALQFMASTLHRAQLLNYTRAGVRRYSKSATDTYMRCTHITFNCNTHVVYTRKTERTMHGPFNVRAWSVRSLFNCRLTSVFIKRSSVKRTVHGCFFLAHTVVRHIFFSAVIAQKLLHSCSVLETASRTSLRLLSSLQ